MVPRPQPTSVDAVFEDMLTRWEHQQLARNFTAATIRGRERLDGEPLGFVFRSTRATENSG